MDDMDESLRREQELEAQMQVLQEQLAEVRAANRDVAIADVKAKIKRYSITRTELATAFPVLRRPKSTSSEPTLNADGTVRKKRGRRSKAEIEAARAAEA